MPRSGLEALRHAQEMERSIDDRIAAAVNAAVQAMNFVLTLIS